MSNDGEIEHSKASGQVAPSQDWRAAALASGATLDVDVPAPRAVMLLVDTSSSMSGLLNEARRGAAAFAHQSIRTRASVGLIGFGTEPSLLTAPCRDPAKIEKSLPSSASGSTGMHLAIALAIEHIPAPKRGGAICIVTDGEPDDRAAALAAADRAKALGIDILTIGVEGADQAFLARLATTASMAVRTSPARLAKDMGEIVLRLPAK